MDSFSKYLILYPCGKILSYHFMIKMLKRTCRWIPSANIWFYIHAAKFFHTILWLKCWRTCFSNWCMTFYIRGTAFYSRWIPSANIWFYIHAAKFFHTILWLKCWRTCFSNWCMTFYIRGTAFYTDLIGSYHIIPGYEAHRLCWWMTVAKLFWVYDLLPVFY